MRLHNLGLRALGPFAAEQSVNFEQLGAGGLFLLDGPTGAGKSTVLDAITFALYGPGERGGDGRLQSHFADAGTAPEVVLEFSVAGVRQRITRSPEFVRPKRRGDGTTTESAQVHLERFEHGTWVSRSSNKAEVGDLIADDIGLSRDQFTQVVLLPQGEFMKFLRAGDDDRRTLLTRLFGTQLYDRITDELDRRRKVADADLVQAERRVHARVSAAGEAAGLDPHERDEIAALGAVERAARFAVIGDQLGSGSAESAVVAAELAGRVAALRGSSAAVEADAARHRRFVAAVRAEREHEASRETFEQASAVVRLADRAAPVRPLLEVVDEASAVLANARSTLPSGVVGSVEALADQAAADQRRAAELAPLLQREQEARQLVAVAERAQAEVAAASAELARLDASQEQLPALYAAAEEALRAAQASVVARDGLVSQHEAVLRRRDAAVELAALEPRRAAALDARLAALAAYETASREHLRLAAERLANIAGELAAGLVDGEPCAVCGSAAHPHPAPHAPDAVSADDVVRAQAIAAAADRHHQDAAAESVELDQRMAVLVSIVDGASLAELTEQLGAIEADLHTAATAVAALSQLEVTREVLATEAAALTELARAASSQVAAAQERLDVANEALANLADELHSAAAGHASVAAHAAALEASARRTLKLAELVRAVDVAAAAVVGATERATAEATRAGFADLASSRAAVQADRELPELRTLVAEWTDEAAARRGALAAAEFDGLDPDVAVERSAAIQQLAEASARELAAVEAEAKVAALAAERSRTAAGRFAAARAEVEKAEREYGELADESAPVLHLAKLARGMSGNRRVNLTTYVLRQWFEQVVAAANLRLAGMSSGRFELVRVDEAGSKAERAGLTLQVLDRHTGEQRSPRSLSGGETFYTSLALALGLADVVRAEAGGVELDTLFIDEGFGSLDADTLDQVMEVIDELRTRGRTVGIVSHVAELKHRIAERIEVRRLPDGSSTLRVVA